MSTSCWHMSSGHAHAVSKQAAAWRGWGTATGHSGKQRTEGNSHVETYGIVGGNGDGMSSINQLLVVGAMETMHCL